MVKNWFNSIKNKSQCAFIQLDIMEFYFSVMEAILDNALSLAKQHAEISDRDLRITKHYRKLLLYHENRTWKKKSSDNYFDVAMGSYDGVKVCELFCNLVLSTANSILKESFGLYMDNGLILVRNVNGQKTDRTREEVTKIFKEIGFEIEIQTNLKVVDFLDIAFNLSSGTYKPYRKLNDNLLYVNTSSDHPPQIINSHQAWGEETRPSPWCILLYKCLVTHSNFMKFGDFS